MSNSTHFIPEITIGLDLGDRKSTFAILNQGGEVISKGTVMTTQEQLRAQFSGYAGALIAIEVGTHSPWVVRTLNECGLDVIVANSRQLPLISKNINKTDANDAVLLARLARTDPELLKPIQHRSAEAQQDLAAIRSRDILVQTRTELQNHVRSVVKSNGGSRLTGFTVPNFHKKVLEQIPEGLRAALHPTLKVIEELTQQIRVLDKHIERLVEEKYPEAKRLSQVKGVGALTALAYILIIEDPKRFEKRRSVGPYLGLAPKKSASGDSDPQLRISKAGDELLRRLMTTSAHYILGPFGEDSDLSRHGKKIIKGGGKYAKKRAVIAVARKLSVLLHSLWCSGEEYEPLRNSKDKEPDKEPARGKMQA